MILSAPAINQSGKGSHSKKPKPLETPCEFDSCPSGSPAYGFDKIDPMLNYVNGYPCVSSSSVFCAGFTLLYLFWLLGLTQLATESRLSHRNSGVLHLLIYSSVVPTSAVRNSSHLSIQHILTSLPSQTTSDTMYILRAPCAHPSLFPYPPLDLIDLVFSPLFSLEQQLVKHPNRAYLP